jgi:translation initiation factor IF-2
MKVKELARILRTKSPQILKVLEELNFKAKDDKETFLPKDIVLKVKEKFKEKRKTKKGKIVKVRKVEKKVKEKLKKPRRRRILPPEKKEVVEKEIVEIPPEIKVEEKVEKVVEEKIEEKIEPIPEITFKEEVIVEEEKIVPEIEEKPPEVKEEFKEIEITDPILVRELARKMQISPAQVVKTLLDMRIIANINQEISKDTAIQVAEKFGFKAKVVTLKEEEFFPEEDEIGREEDWVPVAPVVTIMGHVDHGKTKLLDTIRKSNVMEKEVGGITQHIGAYQVKYNGKKITFIDTPGHEAFTAMRARGASVTDIVVLVVAADSGVMPQTIEAIHHAREAKVPIIVAINKIDKPEANIERVKQQLAEHGLIPEEWGGDTIFCPISAKFGQGIDELLEMIILTAEIAELKANPKLNPKGVIIEAKLDRGRGPVATVLLKQGTLRVGDAVVAGTSCGKIRAMINDEGIRIKEAYPAMPVEILGLDSVPQAGDILRKVENEKIAREIVNKLRQRERAGIGRSISRITLADVHKQIEEGKLVELKIILKGDVQGSIEAISQALTNLKHKEVTINIIHTGCGEITESDILLASASNAVVIGFNVKPTPSASKKAEEEKVDVRTYEIIYDLIEDIKQALVGMLSPQIKEEIIGRAKVLATFKVPKFGVVAGCSVTEGIVVRGENIRVIRDEKVIYEGKIDSLKRFKEDVKEVSKGFECGIGIQNFFDFKEGDELIIFKKVEVKREWEE